MLKRTAIVTEDQLKRAIKTILGEATYHNLVDADGSGLVQAHHAAAIRAFRDNLHGPEIEALREALVALSKDCRYPWR